MTKTQELLNLKYEFSIIVPSIHIHTFAKSNDRTESGVDFVNAIQSSFKKLDCRDFS